MDCLRVAVLRTLDEECHEQDRKRRDPCKSGTARIEYPPTEGRGCGHSGAVRPGGFSTDVLASVMEGRGRSDRLRERSRSPGANPGSGSPRGVGGQSGISPTSYRCETLWRDCVRGIAPWYCLPFRLIISMRQRSTAYSRGRPRPL